MSKKNKKNVQVNENGEEVIVEEPKENVLHKIGNAVKKASDNVTSFVDKNGKTIRRVGVGLVTAVTIGYGAYKLYKNSDEDEQEVEGSVDNDETEIDTDESPVCEEAETEA